MSEANGRGPEQGGEPSLPTILRRVDARLRKRTGSEGEGLLLQAADEIERLTRERDTAEAERAATRRSWSELLETHRRVEAERDAVRAALAHEQADRDALRAALTELVTLEFDSDERHYRRRIHQAWEAARAALKGKP